MADERSQPIARSAAVVRFDETGEEREVVRACAICKPDLAKAFVLSPSGVAHHASDWGDTDCGHDATGPDWWWPL